MEQHDLLTNDLLINNTSQAHLVAAAKWGKFLAITGFIGCVLMVGGGIYFQALGSPGNIYGESQKYVGYTYLAMGTILFFPCLYLNKFSVKILEAIRSSSQESADTAFSNLRSMFKFYGIFTMIMLIFFALALVGTMLTLMR
jgi:hypothetical protein